ncbi:hypothetical protein E2C01_095083 [Portunus trituberculatus]|uniref:Uncharacterized protein n=1 Tax=Portunus trituberculatus TaxID=210409 RepID=A0A5B7JZB2_PORTR|nr:hypothetical protein [Portunus trituberculatus]
MEYKQNIVRNVRCLPQESQGQGCVGGTAGNLSRQVNTAVWYLAAVTSRCHEHHTSRSTHQDVMAEAHLQISLEETCLVSRGYCPLFSHVLFPSFTALFFLFTLII